MSALSSALFLYQRKEHIPLEDVDASGFMYHGNFLKYYDRARTEFLRSLGFSHGKMIKEKSFFVVKTTTEEFMRPVLLEDDIQVTVSLEKIGRTSLGFFQTFEGSRGRLAQARITLVFVGETSRPKPLPLSLIKALEESQARIVS